MYLILESTIKQIDGVIDICIVIVEPEKSRKKSYTYHLSSEYAVRKFSALYRKGRKFHGKALAVLNKFKIKETIRTEDKQ